MAEQDEEPRRGFPHVGDPIVTFDDANPDWLTVTMPTLEGKFDFRLNPSQADVLHYRLGRALHPADTPYKGPSDFL